jgi:hypothetical protein
MTQQKKDALARMGWTALEAGLSVLTVESLGLPTRWVPLIAVLLAAVKSAVATRVGSTETVTFSAPEDRAARAERTDEDASTM